MSAWHIHHVLSIEETLISLDNAYARQVRWQQGFRVNVDARLLLLGARRLLARQVLTEAQLRDAAWIVGCRQGAMESYERFDDGLLDGQLVPLAFAYALPSMPLACVSLCHAIRGPAYTIAGGADAGISAFAQAGSLIVGGLASTVITGCWDSLSASPDLAAPTCRLLLVVLKSDAASEAATVDLATLPLPDDGGVVARLSHFLRSESTPDRAENARG